MPTQKLKHSIIQFGYFVAATFTALLIERFILDPLIAYFSN